MRVVHARRSLLILLALIAITATADVAEGQALTVLTTVLPNGTQGQAYVGPTGVPLLTLNGLPPVGWTVSAGAMPPGLGLVTTLGVTTVTGTPTTQGSFTFSLTATDALARTGTQQYTVVINAPLTITTTSVPDGQVGIAYSSTLAANGGSTPYGWLVVSGSLPPGLFLNPLTGAITGSPTTAGDYAFTVQVTDVSLATATRAYSMKVTTPPAFSVSGTEVWTVNR